MLDTVQVQDCKNKQIEQSQAFARSYYIKSPNNYVISVHSHFLSIPTKQN